MNLWERFRNYFYQRNLRKQLARLQVKRTVINLNDARSIGILFDYRQAENESAVVRFADELKSLGKEVEILGSNKKKEVAANPAVKVLSNGDISWTKVPKGETANSFSSKNFDLLICLFTDRSPTLEYLSCISHSRWRVGAYSPDKTNCYDMMIQLNQNPGTEHMIEQTKHFLNQIHYDSTKT